jgi:hypothetical protein
MNPQEREARWEALKLQVGHCDVVMCMAFHSSLRYWQSGTVDETEEWSVKETGDLVSPLAYTRESSVLICGDCLANISLADGRLIHIQGDLTASIEVGGHSEIVIGGNVKDGAGIQAEGISHIFVGGDVDGFVRSSGSMTLCVRGNMRGNIGTGSPSTKLRVQGDFIGQLQPTKKASLVWLEVQKFMPFSLLESIGRFGYTQFDASIAVSDRGPGIYPTASDYERLVQQRNFYRWIVHASNQGSEVGRD